jgi:hypothetical protein
VEVLCVKRPQVRIASALGRLWTRPEFFVAVAAVLLALLAALVLLLLVDAHARTDTGIIAALSATVLSFVGALLKHSIDTRTERRLRLETCIRAVGLLSTRWGRPSPPVQQAGALFTLVNLDEVEFALALLNEMWPRGDIDSGAATWVIDRALLTKKPAVQMEASAILTNNASKLLLPGGCWSWLQSLGFGWDKHLPLFARRWLFEGLVDVLRARPYEEWTRECLSSMFRIFAAIWRDEDAREIQASATLVLDILLDSLTGRLPLGGTDSDAGPDLDRDQRFRDEIRGDLAAAKTDAYTNIQRIAVELKREWFNRSVPTSPSGSLAQKLISSLSRRKPG